MKRGDFISNYRTVEGFQNCTVDVKIELKDLSLTTRQFTVLWSSNA